MCLIAELTSSPPTKIPWAFGTFPIFSQGLDSTGSDHIPWHIFQYSLSPSWALSPYPDSLGRLEGSKTLNFLWQQFFLTLLYSATFSCVCSNESCSKCLWKTPATQRILVFVISNVSNNSRCLGLTQGKAPSCSSLSCPIPQLSLDVSPTQNGYFEAVLQSGFGMWSNSKLCISLCISGEGSDSELVVQGKWFHCKFPPHGDSHHVPAMLFSDKY